ncbi:MAG: MFS transporter [Desulfomonilaceae bacterium]
MAIETSSHAPTVLSDISKSTAIKFIVLFGIISLFSDFTYEGARSITGPFLEMLGASATVVGVVAGFGELLGYGLRLASGYLTDKTKRYWTIVLFGYSMNLLAVPLLALAGHWPTAAALIVMERTGKGIRTPTRDVMLSLASQKIGRGWGFGLHQALDQTGAVIGPLVVAAVLHFKGTYETSFGILLIPALIALSLLVLAARLYPTPEDIGTTSVELEGKALSRKFWVYVIAIGFVAAGYADFSLIAFHFKKMSIVSDSSIPIFYAVATGVHVLASLFFGRIFDRIGLVSLVAAVFLSSFFAPFVFLGGYYASLIGMALWGIGMGAQSSVVRAAIADLVPTERLGFAFGIFNMVFGLFWFGGSALMGVLYDVSLPALVMFSVVAQLISLPILLVAGRNAKA